MSTKQATIWPAEPHTIAKIEMLRSYLHLWFAILGARFHQRDLWYIDGFAGPGEYTNYPEGSPLAALAAANSARTEVGPRWVARDIRCLFIEEDRARFEHLEAKLRELPEDARIRAQAFHGAFVEGIARLKLQTGNPFASGDPIFAFIDPFGPVGLSFSVVRDLLSRPVCEVLVNLDSDGVGRICLAGENANHRALLNDVFGDESWEPELAGVHQLHEAARRVVALYKRKPLAVRDVNYAFSFEMRKHQHVFDYHLVFASQHPLGLERMKEVMKKFDKSGAYCFSDSHVGQESLFTFDDPSLSASEMMNYFAGRNVEYQEVQTYALNESPFPNPKAMLAVLERSGRIAVDVSGQKRTKCTYPERLHAVMRIQF